MKLRDLGPGFQEASFVHERAFEPLSDREYADLNRKAAELDRMAREAGPDLANALELIRWPRSFCHRKGVRYYCPWCRLAAGDNERVIPHTPNCEWVEALRKAGREP